MKTMLKRTALVAVVNLALASACTTFGETQAPAAPRKEKTYEGTVTSVDPNEGIVTVRGRLMNQTFNAAADCRVSLEGKRDGTFSDLRAGHRVDVRYYDTHGVRVARQITQEDRVFKGRVTALDPALRTVAVKSGFSTHGFVLAEGGTVLVGDDESGSLDGLKIGDTVKVMYQSAKEPITARRIEQKLPTFTGTIRAIDARSRTVTARSLLTEKKFHLSKGCPIVANGKPNGSLSDLRVGDRISASYEDADGILVANRIGREATPSDGEGGQTAALGKDSP